MKKFSKIAAIALAAVSAFALCACGSSTSTENTGDANTENTVTENQAETAEATDVAAAGLKAGFICLHDENSTYDLNFISAAKAACDKLGVEAVFKTNNLQTQDATSYLQTASDMRITSSRLLRNIPMFSSHTLPVPRLTPRTLQTSTTLSLTSTRDVILQVSLQV